MANTWFQFKQFKVHQDRCAMKVTTDSCLFGAWCAGQIQQKKIRRALDIGAGTGLISMMLAQQFSFAIDAVEIDGEAAAQAKENVTEAQMGSIQVIRSDIKDLPHQRYDLIVSNPPFYEQEIPSASEAKRRAHHQDGLIWEDLFREIDDRLESDGLVFLLLPYKRRNELERLLGNSELSLFAEATVFPTPAQAAARLMIGAGRARSIPALEDIYIKDEHAAYSARFTELLKPYYLHL